MAPAGVDALCRNLNFFVFGREARELLFCLDIQEVRGGPGQYVVTSPLIPLPLLRGSLGLLTSSKVSSVLCVQQSQATLQGTQLWCVALTGRRTPG